MVIETELKGRIKLWRNRASFKPRPSAYVSERALSENVFHDEGGVDGWADALAVVGGQHAGVLVAELVSDAFEGDAGIGHDRGGAVAKHVWSPTVADFGGTSDVVELGSDLRWVGGGANRVREDKVLIVAPGRHNGEAFALLCDATLPEEIDDLDGRVQRADGAGGLR